MDINESAISSTTLETKAQKNKLRLNKLQKRLRREMGQAIQDFQMIRENDVVMVCLSGGKTVIPCLIF